MIDISLKKKEIDTIDKQTFTGFDHEKVNKIDKNRDRRNFFTHVSKDTVLETTCKICGYKIHRKIENNKIIFKCMNCNEVYYVNAR